MKIIYSFLLVFFLSSIISCNQEYNKQNIEDIKITNFKIVSHRTSCEISWETNLDSIGKFLCNGKDYSTTEGETHYLNITDLEPGKEYPYSLIASSPGNTEIINNPDQQSGYISTLDQDIIDIVKSNTEVFENEGKIEITCTTSSDSMCFLEYGIDDYTFKQSMSTPDLRNFSIELKLKEDIEPGTVYKARIEAISLDSGYKDNSRILDKEFFIPRILILAQTKQNGYNIPIIYENGNVLYKINADTNYEIKTFVLTNNGDVYSFGKFRDTNITNIFDGSSLYMPCYFKNDKFNSLTNKISIKHNVKVPNESNYDFGPECSLFAIFNGGNITSVFHSTIENKFYLGGYFNYIVLRWCPDCNPFEKICGGIEDKIGSFYLPVIFELNEINGEFSYKYYYSLIPPEIEIFSGVVDSISKTDDNIFYSIRNVDNNDVYLVSNNGISKCKYNSVNRITSDSVEDKVRFLFNKVNGSQYESYISDNIDGYFLFSKLAVKTYAIDISIYKTNDNINEVVLYDEYGTKRKPYYKTKIYDNNDNIYFDISYLITNGNSAVSSAIQYHKDNYYIAGTLYDNYNNKNGIVYWKNKEINIIDTVESDYLNDFEVYDIILR